MIVYQSDLNSSDSSESEVRTNNTRLSYPYHLAQNRSAAQIDKTLINVPELEVEMKNSAQFPDTHVYACPTLPINQRKSTNISRINSGIADPKQNVFHDIEMKQCPHPPKHSPFSSQLHLNEKRHRKLSDPCGLIDHLQLTTSDPSNSLSDLRQTIGLFSPPPPPIEQFRRPNCTLYYPSHHHSYTTGSYKPPSSSPWYLTTGKDCYLTQKKSQSHGRRTRSTTPPAKEIKRLSPRGQFLQSRRNSHNEIWSIPREV